MPKAVHKPDFAFDPFVIIGAGPRAAGVEKLVFAAPDHPDWGFAPVVTDDGAWLVITIWKGTDSRYQVAYLDLSDASAEPVMLIEGFDNDYTFVGNWKTLAEGDQELRDGLPKDEALLRGDATKERKDD